MIMATGRARIRVRVRVRVRATYFVVTDRHKGMLCVRQHCGKEEVEEQHPGCGWKRGLGPWLGEF